MLSESNLLDRVFQALSDPTRRAIVERLVEQPMTVSAIAAPFPMSLPAVMQHLAVLETAGLVRSYKEGRVRTCMIDPVAMRLVEHWVDDRRRDRRRPFDRIDEYLVAAD
ncbi:MAG: winged helix-turn-helix transcriptional regulator [Sphingomonas sp.]|uniref:ArsR/SmtB family transcription factor n=1 Tax=Sphingomonas sp. TaxID=28214 RepID=UPI001AC565F8|nr:metalloregulator ArsR/SmtB family transcription factor [Sphingomonas sp.]MBN8813949.1 winged helix-turn-helix transcriptional regulator [Sphingomonas sp.]